MGRRNKLLLIVLFFVIVLSAFANFANAVEEKCFLVIGAKSRNYTKEIPVSSCGKDIVDYNYNFLKSLRLKPDIPLY